MVFVVLTLAVMAPSPAGAAERRPKLSVIKGLATAVGPSEVTVRDSTGNEVSVQAREDFTERVAVGTKVTARYYVQDGVNRLHWLEHQLENPFVSAQQFVPQIKRAILLSSSDAGDAEGLFRAIEDFLRAEVGWSFRNRILAEEIRSRFDEAGRTTAAIDRSAEKLDLAQLRQVHCDLIRKIASSTGADAVLETKIELVQVNFRSQVAVWDGVRQPVASKASRIAVMIGPRSLEGHVPAATVVLKLWDLQGELLWSNRRGFCVLALEKGITDKFRDRPISEALQDTASVAGWLASVFASWLPAEPTLRQAAPPR